MTRLLLIFGSNPELKLSVTDVFRNQNVTRQSASPANQFRSTATYGMFASQAIGPLVSPISNCYRKAHEGNRIDF